MLNIFRSEALFGRPVPLGMLPGTIRMEKFQRPLMKKKKIIFCQDNAPCHKSMKMTAKLNELAFSVLPRPPYFSDLAPSDYWVSADLKKMLQRKRFGWNEEVIAAIEFEVKDKLFYEHGIE